MERGDFALIAAYFGLGCALIGGVYLLVLFIGNAAYRRAIRPRLLEIERQRPQSARDWGDQPAIPEDAKAAARGGRRAAALSRTGDGSHFHRGEAK